MSLLLTGPKSGARDSQAQREEAPEPPERRIAVEGGVVGVGRVDVTGYGRARPVAARETLRCPPTVGCILKKTPDVGTVLAVIHRVRVENLWSIAVASLRGGVPAYLAAQD